MKISLVSVENSITAIGFRKIAAVARKVRPDVEVCYLVPMGERAFFKLLFKKREIEPDLFPEELARIGQHLGRSDLVCFSSMTPFAEVTQKVIAAVRQANPKTYIVWGGVHAIVNPEDAICSADGICVGEGETAFRNFLEAFLAGKDPTTVKNFWFNKGGRIIRNEFLPLQTSAEMDRFPYPLYADNELIYRRGKGFIPMGRDEYLSYNDLVYNTVWAIGCPYKCTYCSNSKFSKNHKDYRNLRHPSVDYIIGEIKHVLGKHPHISTVRFHDDSFMAIPLETLKHFSEKWRQVIRIPFWVYGLIPVFVNREKMKVLVHSGMEGVRMGIQSGSDKILKFYNRPNRPGLIADSMSIIGEFTPYMCPPYYDIIVDNPIETKQDLTDTLEVMYHAPRPYTILVYALRMIPGTEMAEDFEKRGIPVESITKGYVATIPSLANTMIFLLSVCKLPQGIYRAFLKNVVPYSEQPGYSVLFPFARFLYKVKNALDLIRSLDFSIFPGRAGWLIWKLGIIRVIQRRRLDRAYREINLD